VKQADGLSFSLFLFFYDENYNTRAHSSENRKMRYRLFLPSDAAFVEHVDLGGPRHCHSNNEIARAGSGNDVHVRFVRCRDTSWKIACDGIAMFQDSRDDFNLQIKRIIRIYTMKFTSIAGYFYIA